MSKCSITQLMKEGKMWSDFLNGSSAAFSQLYQIHARMLFSYGLKISNDPAIVEDCIHDLFVYLWNKRETLSQTDSPGKYIVVSFRRMMIKKLSSRQKGGVIPMEDLSNISDATPENAESVWISEEDNRQEQFRLNSAMSKLSKRQQEALHLKYIQELSYEDICDIMEINYQSVRNLISRALFELRGYMKE
jgi:RNA polymerase sigma factor (sigma-70 family)